MKAQVILLTLALCLGATAVAFAKDELHMGTWTLNEAKSKIAAGATKNTTVIYEAVGNDIKVTVDGTDGDGNPTHSEWTGRFNGRFYPVTGDATSDERAYRRVGARTLILTGRKGGKITLNGRIVVTANGKTRTVTTSGTDAKGKRFRTVAVYDKA
jgi:hypothetical protein